VKGWKALHESKVCHFVPQARSQLPKIGKDQLCERPTAEPPLEKIPHHPHLHFLPIFTGAAISSIFV
jgi:hypothetical protein